MPVEAGTDNHLLKLEQNRALTVLSDILDNQSRWHLAFAMDTARRIRDRNHCESVEW
jgi:hypothetical protein